MRALIGDDRLDELTKKIDPDRKLALDFYPLLPGERFPIADPHYLPRLSPRPLDDSIFFQAILEGMIEIERSDTRDCASSVLMRARAMGVYTLAPNSLEAATGTACMVLSHRNNEHARIRVHDLAGTLAE